MIRKLINRLFPVYICDQPPHDPTLRGSLHIVTEVRVSWADIARLVISRRVRIETHSLTTRDPGRAVTSSLFNVLSPIQEPCQKHEINNNAN